MKNVRKAAVFVIAIMMLAVTTLPFSAAAEPETITVSLRIEGVEETLFYDKSVIIKAGASVEELMTFVNEMEESPEIVILGSTWGGTYISGIGGLNEFAHGGYSGWTMRVNDINPTVGQSAVFLEDGDEVIYFYGDPWGEPGMQYPVADLSRLYSDGILSFLSYDIAYDEEFNEIESVNPVVGATVTFGGRTYTTDENGEVKISDMAGLAGVQSLKIERYDEDSGVPTVLRLPSDFEMYVPFVDTPDGIWYDFPVEFSVRAGFFRGIGGNRFAPREQMTVAHLVTVLARIAGVDPELLTGGQWYVASLEWAIENNVLNLGEILDEEGLLSDEGMAQLIEFALSTYVTREDFIYMFYLTAGITGTYDMDVRADISGAADYDSIAEERLEAVSWAVASGIIRGTGGAAMTISPHVVVNRATVCQMLYNYYN